MNTLIKICGLREEAAVRAAVEAGANAVGFVFEPTSVRFVSAREAARLVGLLPENVISVAVFKRPARTELAAVLNEFAPDVLQLDEESLDEVDPGFGGTVWPVVRNREPESAHATVVFEGPVSGAGSPADWKIAAMVAKRRDVVLAGGLDKDNVGRALDQVAPCGVDVSSGVESEPGVKSPQLIRAFCEAVREHRAASEERSS